MLLEREMKQLITSDNLFFQKKSCNCGFGSQDMNRKIMNLSNTTARKNKKKQTKRQTRKTRK